MTIRITHVFLISLFSLAGCQSGPAPVTAAGAEAYTAIALPQERLEDQRYALRSGDIISILVFEEPDLSREEIAIDAGGNLDLPLIGEVRASGKDASELARQIEQAYAAQYLRHPNVSVSIDKSVGETISVEGQVAQPGKFPFEPGQTLLTAIAQARSPTNVAKLDEVLIFRTVAGQRMGGQFDLRAIRAGAADDPALAPGDVIVVGYSSLKGTYRDILQAAPILGVFGPF